jgi:DNA-directed RNA polymerase omega subunit
MGYQPLEELLPRSGFSVYKLVCMAANRAVELADGKPKLIDIVNTDKLATLALEEIMAGKVELKAVAEQRLISTKVNKSGGSGSN